MGMGQISQGLNIGQFHQRIGRRFQIEQPGFRADGGGPGGGIAQRHVSRSNAKFAEILIEQRNGAAEHAAGRNDMVAAVQQRHAGGQNRRHPGTGGDTSVAAFQRRQTVLKRSHRRVGKAGIDVALAGAETGGSFGRVGEYEAGSEKQRLGVFALVRAHLTGAHRQAGETEFSGIIAVVHWLCRSIMALSVLRRPSLAESARSRAKSSR